MTKTNRKTLASFLVLLLTCAILAVTAGALLTARAASAFSADFESSAVYPGGQSKATITKALNDKIVALNADIQAAKDADKALETAYADGDILAYSVKNDGIITQDNKRSGWKVWEGAAVLDLRFLNAGYNGWGDNSVGWLMYNGVENKAYLVTAEFADKFQNGGNQKLGTAVSDMFRVGDVKYQNFTNGYIKSESGSVTVVNRKNVNTQGQEVDADPTASGFVGAATEATLTKAGVSGTQFAQAFVDTYNRFKTEGYNVGYPSSPVMENGKNSGGEDRYGTIYAQNFRWGSSVCDPWNDSGRSGWSALVYNFEQARVYLIADEFWYQFEGRASGDVLQLGDPTGDAFLAADGNRYQNFEKGYMKATGETPQNKAAAEVVLNKNVDENGVAANIDMQSKIGVLGKTVTDGVLPAGKPAAELTADFKAAYSAKVAYADGEELSSVDLAAYADGYISQKYTDNNGKVHMLAYIAESDSFVYFRPAVVEKIVSALGVPTAERVEVASTEGQNIYAYPFASGYIKLTVSEQETIVGGGLQIVTNESAVMLEGATFDSDKVFFETTSFADRITADRVNDAVLNDAYWSLWGVEKPTKAAIAAAFKTAYEEAFALGFSAGKPSDEGIVWWTTGQSGIIKLTLKGGNGNGSFFQDNTLMSYDPATGKVYITAGGVATSYASEGASGNGWATSEMMLNTKTGDIVQQFTVTDPDVDARPVYIAVVDGVPQNKLPGNYDFEANKNGGEWVPYLTQFGGSISSKPVNVEAVKAGEAVNVDFGSYVENKDGYKLTWALTSDKGTLGADGKFTLTAMPDSDLTVTVEVYSAFDKLTLTATVKPKTEGGNGNTGTGDGDNTGNQTPGGKKKKCGSNVIGGGAGAAAVTIAFGLVLLLAKKRKIDA